MTEWIRSVQCAGTRRPWSTLGLISIALSVITGCATIPHGPEPTPPGTEEVVPVKVAIIDFRPELKHLSTNIQELEKLVGEALEGGAKLVVAPEQATTGFGITAEEVRSQLGLSAPFPQLGGIARLADKYDAYVTLGIAEIGSDGNLYNTAVTFGQDGSVHIQRKRLAAANASFGWNSRGNDPFDVIETPYGDLGILICADTFLMDWTRISTLNGADILLVPANWWGQNDQIALWQVRAKEDGVWIVVANRWGAEPNTFPPPASYYMSDGPSAVVTPEGFVQLAYSADNDPKPHNRILFHTLHIPRSRIGTGHQNPAYSVKNRRPSAYSALRNDYYVTPNGNKPPPGLPAAGQLRVRVVTYTPDTKASANLATIKGLLPKGPSDVILLPGLGYIGQELDAQSNPLWYTSDDWKALQALVQEQGAQMLVTSVLERNGGARHISSVVVRPSGPPQLMGQIHDSGSLRGTGLAPTLVDLAQARVAILTGIDTLFPEIATAVAKSGVDTVLISSAVLGRGTPPVETLGLLDDLPRNETLAALQQTWSQMATSCFHVAAADTSGYGFVRQQGSYCMLSEETRLGMFNGADFVLDSSTQRAKLLNWYYPFDIDTLVPGTQAPEKASPASAH
jgi:predicted amidohydrolase